VSVGKVGGDLRARLATEGLDASAWGNAPGDTYAAHRHGYDKVLAAEHGSITFHLVELGRDVDLKAGERLDLPAGTLHAATVGGAGVRCLEAHLPAGTLGAEPRHVADW
jgi:mannose-6-phosphate isomerase-like protein (cupin superfamily)